MIERLSLYPVVPYQYVATTGSGHTPSRAVDAYWEQCDVPWVTTADVKHLRSGVRQVLDDTELHISELGVANSAARLHPPGTVVLSRTAASSGFSAILGRDMATSQDFVTWTPDAALESRFLLWVLRAMRLVGDLDRLSFGSTHKTIYVPDLQQLRGPLPSPETQRRVADFLDRETRTIDTLIRRENDAVALAWEHFWSTVERVTHRGLRETEMQGNAVWGEQPRHWDSAPLGRLATSMVDGPFGSSLTSAHYRESGRRVVRLGNIGRATFKNEVQAFIDDDHYESLRAHSVIAGDLLIGGLGDDTSSAPAGRACVVPLNFSPGIVKADCYRLRLQDSLRHDFAAWSLSSPSQLAYASAIARGATRPRLNLSLAAELPMPVPPVTEQEEIVTFLRSRFTAVRRLEASLARQQDLLRERRRSLITGAVTGRLDI